MTAQLVREFQNPVIESLNIAGMMQGRITKARADAGTEEIKRQLVYKGQGATAALPWPGSSTRPTSCATHANK